jgi:hypothetical protein
MLSLGRQDRYRVGVANAGIERIGLEWKRGAHRLDDQVSLLVAVGWLEQEAVLGV